MQIQICTEYYQGQGGFVRKLVWGQPLVDYPHKGPILQSFMFSLLLAWLIYWTKSWVADDLRHRNTHVTSL